MLGDVGDSDVSLSNPNNLKRQEWLLSRMAAVKNGYCQEWLLSRMAASVLKQYPNTKLFQALDMKTT